MPRPAGGHPRARAPAPPASDRAILITRPLSPDLLRFYLPLLRSMPDRGVPIGEIDVVGLATLGRFGTGTPRPPRPTSLRPPAGFAFAGLQETSTYTLIRFRSRALVRL